MSENRCGGCGFPLAIGEDDLYGNQCRLCFEREWAEIEAEDDSAYAVTGEPRTTCVVEGNRLVMKVVS